MDTAETPDSELSMKALAAQLRQPSGAQGIAVGDQMYQSNMGMITAGIAALSLPEEASVLELGHGNGAHIPGWLRQIPKGRYTGLECAELMRQEALQCCADAGLSDRVHFDCYDGCHIPYPEASFDGALTVNTLYFWEQPLRLLASIYRVLKPGAYAVIAFVDAASMEQLPFTQYGFTHYDIGRFRALLQDTAFKEDQWLTQSEMVINKMGLPFQRQFHIARLQK